MRAALVITGLVLAFMLASCEQRFRYACQNPDNWATPQCQKPLCEVNQECPEYVFSDQKRMEPWIGKDAPQPAESKDNDKGGKNECVR